MPGCSFYLCKWVVKFPTLLLSISPFLSQLIFALCVYVLLFGTQIYLQLLYIFLGLFFFHHVMSFFSVVSLCFKVYFVLYEYCYRGFWRRRWHPSPVLLPGKSHGWRNLVGCSSWGCEESDTTERLPFHFSLSCIGEGNGNPLQCSCLENPRDGGAWWAMVSHRVGHD